MMRNHMMFIVVFYAQSASFHLALSESISPAADWLKRGDIQAPCTHMHHNRFDCDVAEFDPRSCRRFYSYGVFLFRRSNLEQELWNSMTNEP